MNFILLILSLGEVYVFNGSTWAAVILLIGYQLIGAVGTVDGNLRVYYCDIPANSVDPLQAMHHVPEIASRNRGDVEYWEANNDE